MKMPPYTTVREFTDGSSGRKLIIGIRESVNSSRFAEEKDPPTRMVADAYIVFPKQDIEKASSLLNDLTEEGQAFLGTGHEHAIIRTREMDAALIGLHKQGLGVDRATTLAARQFIDAEFDKGQAAAR